MENSIPCEYKTVKDIEKPFGIYHYVVESSCCAKNTEIGSPILGGQIGEVLVFFYFQTHTQTNKQTNQQTISFASPTGHKYGTNWMH